MITEQLIKTYADILEKYQSITFEDDEKIYRIWENGGGWEYDILEVSTTSLWSEDLENVICSDPWIPMDGGIYEGHRPATIDMLRTIIK